MSRVGGVVLRLWVVGVVAFLFLPIITVALYAFNSSNVQRWPIAGLSTKWFPVAWHDSEVHAALLLSVKAGLLATAVALVLGSLAAFGVHRFRFFGRETVSLLLVLPLALPGIITGIALNSTFAFLGIQLSLFTIVIGHASHGLARPRPDSDSMSSPRSETRSRATTTANAARFMNR